MIKKYLNHVYSKDTHERRRHAMQLATGLTSVAFIVWVTTLGLRFALTPQQIAAQNGTSNQVASIAASQEGNATLIVATSTNSSDTNF
jgi:hypothetical protein